MRRVQRPPLPLDQNYLDQRQNADQQRADGTLDIERRWADARQQAIAGTADSVLTHCADGRPALAVHVLHRHFAARHRAFPAPRPLTRRRPSTGPTCCCAAAHVVGSGAQFPLDPAGEPLFIDPSHDDPGNI